MIFLPLQIAGKLSQETSAGLFCVHRSSTTKLHKTMKQKMVIKVSMHNQKSRKKALTIVVGCSGVTSAALKGDDLRQIELTGDGVDVIALTKLLRKKVGHAELVSVGPLQQGDKEKKEQAMELLPPNQFWHDRVIVYKDRYPDSVCSIL